MIMYNIIFLLIYISNTIVNSKDLYYGNLTRMNLIKYANIGILQDVRFTSNSLNGYKLSFYQNMFHLDMISHLHFATAGLSVNILNQASLGSIGTLITLLNVRAGQSALDNFNQDNHNNVFI